MRIKTEIQLHGESYSEALNYIKYITKGMEVIKFLEIKPNWYQAKVLVNLEDYKTLVQYRDIEMRDSKYFVTEDKQEGVK